LHERMATAIVSKIYDINVYPDDGRTTIENLGLASNNDVNVVVPKKNIKKLSKKIRIKRCPNCGALIPPEQYRETDICPSCEEKIHQVA